ncbi:hypothetical protein Cob_v011841 [Colletotrichum orbiculare MAFF 240422]|uniref:Protein kinase domain-containing protein n=1 Tax=Colletotrichum orbiculare (strain 104-T / ATCC 96160 / CBS 514.97 / LARS 414 / MAFF 240422) TaxID=1213857 RepID=A0A484FBG1_COLOR|nr:hypothetical protein Cob_v011841 [Colletotrichum orbiculare MAFF 240422]
MGILIFMKQAIHIEDFFREEFFDHHLPLRQDSKVMRSFRARLGSDKDDCLNTTMFSSWKRVNVDLFYIYQKMMVVPYFHMGDNTLRSYIMPHDVRLPWAEYDQKTSRRNGVIHQLQIHPDHYSHGAMASTNPDCSQWFAVREIHAADHESHRQELRAFEMSHVKLYKEEHIIKLLCTFQHGQQVYLLYQWTDGNLREFWTKREPSRTPIALKWMSQQCMGIARAIMRVHGQLTCYTGIYRAPEIGLGDPISTKYDILSLGCVFLEFCIWYLRGADAIKSFENARRRYIISKDMKKTGELDTVTLQEASCSPYINGMLDMIINRMLVVDPHHDKSSIELITADLSDTDAKLAKLTGDSTVSSATVDIATGVKDTLVKFAEGNSTLGNDITLGREKELSIS